MPDGQGTSFFGDLLKRFRQDKHLTQQQLAEKIGASRESISLWERGAYKPETTTMVHELARVLKLDEEEKRLLFEAHAGTASVLPVHNFPEHNSYFTGREEILNSLHAYLTAGKQVALIQAQAISGLGGIGKTQVAIEYAYRFREHYHDILWVDADSRVTLMTSYLTLARHLRLPEREEREQHKVVEAVKRWLREHKRWLLILDNIEDLGLVREFVPAPRQGTVVLTTRRGETRPVAEALVLEDLPEEEALLFLLRRAGYVPKEAPLETASAGERAAALAIVQIIGGLPLALDQAGAYVAETKRGLSDYLDLFKKRQKDLLDLRGTLAYEHPRSVVATFSLAFEQVQQKNEAAIDLLKLCAYLAPDVIPLEIFTEGAAHLGTALETAAADALQLDQMLETLQAYSLVRRDRESRTLSIHRLVQAVLQDAMPTSERERWRECVITALNAVFPEVGHTTWKQCERLVAHALIYAASTQPVESTNLDLAFLLFKTARYLDDRAQYREAEPLYQRALHICEQAQGPDHPQVASFLNGLAILYYQQGKYSEAEPLYQRALRIWEQALGPDHHLVAHPLTGLAILHKEQGKYSEAELLYQRALAIQEQALGPEHPATAETLHDFAVFQYAQGNMDEAASLYQRALAIREQALGQHHSKTVETRKHYVSLLREMGRHDEAASLEAM